MPGISRRERDEADFDAKSGRETERNQKQVYGKVAGVLGAFCKHLLSVSAWNQIILTRATDSDSNEEKHGKGRRGLCFPRGKEERIPIDSRVSACYSILK